MIEEIAIVASVSGSRVLIESRGGARSCGGCQQQEGCASSVLNRMIPRRRIAVDTDIAVKPGDKVVVGVDERALIKGSLIIYLAPLLALFAGAMAGDVAISRLGFDGGYADAGSAIAAILAFLSSFSLVKRSHGILLGGRLSPVLLRKL